MPISRARASQRAKKGWVTRRRNEGARVQRSRLPMRGHKWVRPSGEVVRLKGFNDKQLDQIKPALTSTDALLKPQRDVNAVIKLQDKKLHDAVYKLKSGNPRAQIGASTTTGRVGKAKINVSKTAFTNRSRFTPSGLVAHEIGHAIGPEKRATRNQMNDFARTFGYKQGNLYTPERWKKQSDSILKRRRTRQSVNADEDFAETYRSLTNLPLGKTNRKGVEGRYFRTVTSPERITHMQRYYIR